MSLTQTISEDSMLVEIKDRQGNLFYLNTELVEVVIEREGNTSEIVLTNGKRYTSIKSPAEVKKIINDAGSSNIG